MNMIAQLLPAASKAGILRAPFMDPTDKLPLVSGTDVAAAADAVLKNFDAYVGQVRSLDASPWCSLSHDAVC